MFRLLIADDESLERQAIKFIVNKNCSEISKIEEASNGREAIEKTSIFKPHIILLDIKMPGIDGIEAASKIKKLYPECRIIFLTAFDYFEYAREAIKIGVENFIVKPAEDEQIIEAVKSITNSLKKVLDEKNEQNVYEDKLAKVTTFLESEIVSALSIGEVNEDQLRDLFEVMDIHFTKGCASIVKIQSEGLQFELLSKLYSDKIKDYMEQKNVFCLVNIFKPALYIIAFPKKDMELSEINEYMKVIYKDIYYNIDRDIKKKFSIGIGNSFSDIKGIYKSFSDARISCACCKGDISIQHYIEINKIENNTYPLGKEKALCDKIVNCDEVDALQIYDEIMEWIESAYDFMEDKIIKSYELIVVINRRIASEGKDKSIQISLKYLQEAGSEGEIRSIIKEAIVRLTEEMMYLKNDSGAANIEKVCEYINSNYNEQITLDDLANMIGFSSFYFSKIFKMYKGMNFIDYLTYVRINRGKELLKESSLSVKEISELIGYNNADYFTRVFRRSEGVTPTDYRNRKKVK